MNEPAIWPINVVPVVSKISPDQNRIRCHGLSRWAKRSAQTATVYRVRAAIMVVTAVMSGRMAPLRRRRRTWPTHGPLLRAALQPEREHDHENRDHADREIGRAVAWSRRRRTTLRQHNQGAADQLTDACEEGDGALTAAFARAGLVEHDVGAPTAPSPSPMMAPATMNSQSELVQLGMLSNMPSASRADPPITTTLEPVKQPPNHQADHDANTTGISR